MHGCVASQPILNLKKEIFGYELLYRSNKDSVGYDGVDGSLSTKGLILTAFSEIGIENITRGRKAFVNFTTDLILEEVPEMLSNDILVVEILESVELSESVLIACRELKKKGYLIALDDFVYSDEKDPLIALADIIKIDFRQYNEEEIKGLVEKLKKYRRKVFLAEKVETIEDFDLAVSLGFTLFQGYFFCKPSISSAKQIDTLMASRFQLIRIAADPDIDFQDLANIIKPDVVLSYRLLKIVNSAYYGIQYSIKGVLHALIILGMREAKKWLSFIILDEAIGAKPDELIRMALIRGIIMENFAVRKKDRSHKDEYFMTGLFSLADAIMDASIEDIMEETHLSPEICEPLITKQGERADFIKIISHMEQAEWDDAAVIASRYGMGEEEISNCYLEAILYANRIIA